MLTWICPKCGREVGPSYFECPFCAEVSAAKPAAAPPPVAAPPQPQYVPPPPPQPQYQLPPQVQQQYAPQQYAPQPMAPQQMPPQQMPQQQMAPPPPPPPAQQVYYVGADDHKKSIPPWLAAVLACAAVAAVVFAVVYFARGNRSESGAATSKAGVAKPAAPGGVYSKYLELTGFRISEQTGKKLAAQFLAVNHGAADLSGIEGVITLQVKGDPNADPAVTFKFSIENLPAFGAKEIEVKNFTQQRKFFDMPDWQFLTPVIEFTSTE